MKEKIPLTEKQKLYLDDLLESASEGILGAYNSLTGALRHFRDKNYNTAEYAFKLLKYHEKRGEFQFRD